jgi:hypothetical protein
MRLTTLILSAAIALMAQAALSASASAITATASQAVADASNCPVYEGYPGCHPDDQYAASRPVNERAA